MPEFEQFRDIARDVKNHTLAHLDFYLEEFASRVEAAGGQVHWCPAAEDARDAVLAICRNAAARAVTKGKSMISEETALNDHLEKHGIQPVETDLGEYILQLRREMPSHIIARLPSQPGGLGNLVPRRHTDLPRDRVFAKTRDVLTETHSACAPASSPPISASPAPTS